MEEKFNLSEKIIDTYTGNHLCIPAPFIWKKDVKEFIERLKEELLLEYPLTPDEKRNIINNLAGKELSGEDLK